MLSGPATTLALHKALPVPSPQQFLPWGCGEVIGRGRLPEAQDAAERRTDNRREQDTDSMAPAPRTCGGCTETLAWQGQAFLRRSYSPGTAMHAHGGSQPATQGRAGRGRLSTCSAEHRPGSSEPHPPCHSGGRPQAAAPGSRCGTSSCQRLRLEDTRGGAKREGRTDGGTDRRERDHRDGQTY